MTNDPVLDYFIQEVERTGVGSRIALLINGLIIVGNTMRSKEYFDIMSTFRGAPETFTTTDPVEVERGKQTLNDYRNFFLGQRKETIKDIPYIHIKDATVFTPGIAPAYAPITPLRCKVLSIDAWSTGGVTRASGG